MYGHGGYDVLYGRGGDDTLYGGTEGDTLDGGLGNDTLHGESGNDGLYGGAGDDVLNGGDGDDALVGDSGADVLTGGAGNDYLEGGTGGDRYVFNLGDGQDTIYDMDGTAGNVDRLAFGAGIAVDQLWFQQLGADLSVSVIGRGDSVLMSNWYLGGAYRVENIELADGGSISDSALENLVQAMAAFAPPSAGETSLPQSYRDVLAPVIAASWQWLGIWGQRRGCRSLHRGDILLGGKIAPLFLFLEPLDFRSALIGWLI